MPRTILHIDLDAFFCAVEENQNPSLRGKAFAVGGKPQERGVVASCSYAARRMGVRSAMPMSRALRLCPGLIIVSSRHRLYGEVSRQVMEVLHEQTPLVEQISIDEAFLDVSDIRDEPERFGRRLQARIRDELHLPCSIGIASNKLVAKLATEVGKALALKRIKEQGLAEPPNALTAVPFGEEAAFLNPLPADMLWGVGPKTSARLAELGMNTIGDIARWPESELIRLFGENGRDLARHAKGLDDRPIVTERETKSISQEVTFSKDVRDDRVLEETLREQSAEVARQLRKNNLTGKTIKLKIRWPDFTTLTRQTTLNDPTDSDELIARTALQLMKAIRKPGQSVRLVGVGVSGLGAPVRQLGLWDMDSEKTRRLQETVDDLQEKYGRDVINEEAQKEIDVKILDLKKQYKYLYQPSAKKIETVQVPRLQYAMVDGAIEKGSEPGKSPSFAEATQTIYSLSYTLKFMLKKHKTNPIDYPVMALQGLWWVEDGKFDITIKDNWFYTLMIMQPEVITPQLFEEARDQVRKKKGDSEMLSKTRLAYFEEGLCVQVMHIGPYATEPATIERMRAYMQEHGLKDNVGPNGKHHEIYLSDPRKASPDKMKTVLRHPVVKI